MPPKRPISKATRKNVTEANFKHGLYVIRDRDESALTPAGRSRLSELRDQFMSEPGRLEYRQELAAHLALMLEVGFSHLHQVTEAGGALWEAPPIKTMGTYLNTLVRLLDGWPKDKSGMQDITAMLRGEPDDSQED